MILISLVKTLTKKFPTLPLNLKKAGMHDTPEEFVKKTLVSAIYLSIGLIFVFVLMMFRFWDMQRILVSCLVAFPVIFSFVFFYFFQLPYVRTNRIDREINKEIVYAGRFLIVELESGVSLYDAMNNLGRNFPVVGAYFQDIVERINVGTPIEDAVTEAIERSPSNALTKMLWQISNSLRTGGDISLPLKTVIETLIREQQIAMNEYAKKLNPLAMFYMMIAVIMPSLGITMLTIVIIFTGSNLDLSLLLIIAGFIGFMQLMFVGMINSIRPPVEL